MANTPGAKKAVRKIARRTEVNTARRSRVRTFLRKFEEAVTSGDAAVAKDAFVKAQSELMRAVTKGVVHKNTGSRKVSRLAAQSPLAVMMNKELVNAAFETTLATGVNMERRLFHSLFAFEDQKEGMAAFIDKRKPDFKGR